MPKQIVKKTSEGDKVRVVIFPNIKMEERTKAKKCPITFQLCQTLLGWEEVGKGDKKDDYLFTWQGKRIRCNNNAGNRPFTEETARSIAQDILNLRYKMNCENIIVGKTGLCLSCQHRLVGLAFAVEAWRKDQEEGGPGHWSTNWPTEPTIDSLVAYGCEEDDETVRTLDNTRPRSFADVLYTSGKLEKLTPIKREKISKLLGHAIKLIWDRTGHKNDAYCSRLTNSELTDFVQNHPRISRAVTHIFKEDVKNSKINAGVISNWIGPGTAAGLLYLMGCCESDAEAYNSETPRSEKNLVWSKEGQFVVYEGKPTNKIDKDGMWDMACAFWTTIAINPTQRTNLHPLLEAIGMLADTSTGRGGSIRERVALIVEAWNLFKTGTEEKPATIVWDPKKFDSPNNIALEYKTRETGEKEFVGKQTLGGIDNPFKEEDEVGEEDSTELTPEQVAENKKKIDEEREAKQLAARKERQDKAMELNKPQVITTPANNNPKPKAGSKPPLKGGV